MKKIFPALLALLLVLVLPDAEARRMGGGKSVGRQSSNVTQREAAPPAGPTTPAQNANNAAAKPGSPAAAPAAAAPKRPWGAMLGGLAAGLGLAWLASSLGLGAGFGQVLLLLVVGFALFALIRVLRSRSKPMAAASPLAFQGAAAGPAPANAASMARDYSPDKVGNDASARPWERSSLAFEAQRNTSGGGSIIGSALSGAQNWAVPSDFDTAGFLDVAKRNFVTLQTAWDNADMVTLRSMMTDEMLAEIRTQLAEREAHRGASQPNHTEVVMLEAQLLGIEHLADTYVASVEFSGMIREEQAAGPGPFREVWNMTKPTNGQGGWLVAGVQALQ